LGIFEKFGEYYDLIYRNIKDYENECRTLEQIFTKFRKKKSRNILDVGCGTGSHALILAKHGCSVVGIDISKMMVEKARTKAKKEKTDVQFYVQDMRKMQLDKEFDCAISMFGAIGYILTYEDLVKVLSRLKKHLNKDGLFAFEFWNIGGVKPSPYQRWLEASDAKKTVYRFSETNLNPQTNILTLNMHFLVLNEDRLLEKFNETHVHRCYTLPEIREYLENNGFKFLSGYDWDAEDRSELKEPRRETFRILAVFKKG
jgi:cyclopropane fatty-acyl-phospholipid synthase-like methyltransferase